ncbi:class E sortase [Streptomyces sp. NPDC006638]|uniref:class E sortase n=1 Tax=Streptomyces sp. NPDC006638 TaxID=3157183 RepID=UPI0033B6B33A
MYSTYRSRAVVPALACALAAVLGGSSAVGAGGADSAAGAPAGGPPASVAVRGAGTVTGMSDAGSATTAPSAPSVAAPSVPAPSPRAPSPRIVNATLTIPSIDIKALRVVPYQGTTDDWPGTRIQDRGIAASPYGPDGGVGPGQVGNYLVTGHRLSAGGPLREVPSLKTGDRVFVTAGGVTYEYRITESRITSFRSASSLADQRAAVPGFPGKQPTKAMITLSTCATPEDNAAGNFWRDDRHNPEHRIDKVGELVAEKKASTP